MLKFQHFGYLMRRADSLEKTLMLEKIEGRRRRGKQSNFTVEKAGRYHLIQVIKVNITTDGTVVSHQYLVDGMQEQS